MAEVLDVERDGPVTRLTLADPETLNSLSDAMLAALDEALERVARSDARVVVLQAEGKAFCAGHNLGEMQALRQAEDGGAAGFATLFDRCAEVMTRIRTLPQPVIAKVHGLATAAGCQLVATCDLAIASEAARFGVNGVNIGLFCSTPMVALSRNVGRKQAFEMLVTGEFIDADRARDLGLVNRVVPADRLEDETTALVELVASKLGAAVRIGKGAFHAQAERSEAEAYAMTRDAMVANLMEPDTDEGMRAFLEKRSPGWTQ
jgi:enoyl-CoA hydratase/carnithine racemase